MRFRYFALHKPFGYLSQFSDEAGHPGLLKLKLDLPKDVWPIGRLDRDSEGLILLSNDNQFKSELLNPDLNHPRHYWAQVEGEPTAIDLQAFERPMNIKVRKQDFQTKPAFAKLMKPPDIHERVPPIRLRQSIPTSWVQISLTEGKNRQVRKMTAHAGYPTLRLVRVGVGRIELDQLNLAPGTSRELTREEAFQALNMPE
ncbi:MAG: pseudouridine synthase [Flavobacteriales bacterium]